MEQLASMADPEMAHKFANQLKDRNHTSGKLKDIILTIDTVKSTNNDISSFFFFDSE